MEDDPDKLKGPGGLTLRQVHEQVQKSVARDRETEAARVQKPIPNFWQRLVNRIRGGDKRKDKT